MTACRGGLDAREREWNGVITGLLTAAELLSAALGCDSRLVIAMRGEHREKSMRRGGSGATPQ
jgi:hypothetical protein